MTLSVNLRKIKNSTGKSFNYEFEENDFNLTQNLKISKPLILSLIITNKEDTLHLKGTINTEVMAKCDRCLEKVKIPINTKIEEELISVVDVKKFNNLSKDELEEKYIIYNSDVFDLSDIIRENILQSVPIKILCNEQCKGICPKCGQNLNLKECKCENDEIDPRLAVLAKLKRD